MPKKSPQRGLEQQHEKQNKTWLEQFKQYT